MRRRVTISMLAALSVLLPGRAADATTLLERMPLAKVTAEAGRIVYGTVTDVRSERDERGIPATWVTLDVARTVKGTHHGSLTVKQLGAGQAIAQGGIGRMPGLPTYRVGDEVVLFLRPESAHGFTSPVGFADGVYRVRREGARRVARPEAAADDAAASGDVDAFLDRVEALVRGTR